MMYLYQQKISIFNYVSKIFISFGFIIQIYCLWKLVRNKEKKNIFRIPTQMKSVRKMSEVMMQSAPRPIAACEFLVYSNSVALELVEM